METGWYFPPNNGGEETGLHEAGIEAFRAEGSLAREALQNSIDAALSLNEGPVKVQISRSDVPREEIPGLEELEEVITKCRDTLLGDCRTEAQRKENGEATFKQALEMCRYKTIPVLRISDYSTTGLRGNDHDRISAWYRLLRRQGMAAQHGAGGGTFGIGQRAPFAYSVLRTVFYSTRTETGAACIGKAIWNSFMDGSTSRRNVGFWGKRLPSGEVTGVTESTILPGRLQRKEIGLDLHILGFQDAAWSSNMRRDTLINFFVAISDGRLEVEFQEKGATPIVVDAQSLEYRLRESTLRAKTKADRMQLEATQQFLEAFRRPYSGAPIIGNLPSIGEVALYLKIDPSGNNRIAHMRSPRILVNSKPIAGLRGFSGVFICDNPSGNRALAKLEDPTHTKWERGSPGGSAILGDVHQFLKSQLEHLLRGELFQQEDIPELNKYLPEEGEVGSSRSHSSQGVPEEDATDTKETALPQHRSGSRALLTRASQLPRTIQKLTDKAAGIAEDPSGTWGGAFGQGPGKRGTGPGQGAGPLTGGGPRPGSESPGPRPVQVRLRAFFEPSTGAHRLLLVGEPAPTIALSLSASGEDGAESVLLERAEAANTGVVLAIVGDRVQVPFDAGRADIRVFSAKRRRFLLSALAFNA